jgi:signal transduction histidine kinase
MSLLGTGLSTTTHGQAPSASGSDDAPASVGARPRVLIIDDQAMARAWARGILQTEFDCFETASVQEFFELALRERPDVILADLEMVPLSGIQLCRLAKAKPALASVPFLLLTAHESAEDKISSLADGADDHLAKSITPRELVGRVRATVRLRRSLLRAANLEALVEQRTSELRAASVRLEAEIELRERVEAELRLAQKLEAVGQLAAGVAHEINTPLQYVNDSLEFLEDAFADAMSALGASRALLERGVLPEPGEFARIDQTFDIEYLCERAPDAFRLTREGLARVTGTVRALKDFVNAGQLEKAPTDLNEALGNVLAVTRSVYKDLADVELDLGALPEVVCHVGELNQVFVNLLVNAAEAIAQVVPRERGTIRVTTRVRGERAIVEIEDTGCGIAEAIRARIFEPFFTTKPVGTGTGQGLALAHRVVVEKHGGKLGFEPVSPRGARFSVELPLELQNV